MPRPFSQATAEQVVSVAEAAVALSDKAEAATIATFTDLPQGHTDKALELAIDMGLLKKNGNLFEASNPLCKLLRTPHDRERAAVLRIMLESFLPFTVFREELEATKDAGIAASRTKAKIDLACHREDVKDTLLSLATYSGALIVSHGGSYERDSRSMTNLLLELAVGSEEIGAAIHIIRQELSDEAANLVDHDAVIVPLATSLRHASAGGAGREAVLHAGNAVDTFLDWYAAEQGGNLQGATGINGKLDKLQQQSRLPKKLVFIGKYVGHVRNAADHGNDADIGAPWNICDATGRNFVFVAVSFIRSVIAYKAGRFEA